MPSRLRLSFPGHLPGDEPITFVCDSGDYDHPDELSLAQVQVFSGLSLNNYGGPVPSLTLEDC